MDDEFIGDGGFIRDVRIDTSQLGAGYPYDLPAVAWLARAGGVGLAPSATFLVGENGSGKSTLIEAIAVACGFNPEGLYILDEPEAALSVRGCLAALRRMHDLIELGSQFIVATHSPILLALPGATILQIADDGAITEVSYDDALPVTLTKAFLSSPAQFLRHLLTD